MIVFSPSAPGFAHSSRTRPTSTQLVLNLSDWTVNNWIIAIPFWFAVGAGTCVPFFKVVGRAKEKAIGYGCAALATGLIVPVIYLPIYQLQKALGK